MYDDVSMYEYDTLPMVCASEIMVVGGITYIQWNDIMLVCLLLGTMTVMIMKITQ